MHATLIFGALALPLLTFAAPVSDHPNAPKRLPYTIFARQDNGTCDLSTLPQPANTMTPPTPDLTLALIALGRGTQNYTCPNATAVPAAIGAVATLFNASCAVATNTLGSITEDAKSIGAHFFVDNTTPDFDIIGLGNTQAKKVESMAAPEATNVPWLKLQAQAGASTGPVRQIYRLNTVGGVAPTNCEGVAAGGTVTVDYEAQYWVYAATEELNARRKRRSLGA